MSEIRTPDINVQTETNKASENFNPDKRVDVSNDVNDKSSNELSTEKSFDPDKRVENSEKDFSEPNKISYEIHTRNESLEGDRHPITGVPFEKKTVKDADGNEVTGVFPVFDSKFDAKLPDDLLQASDKDQFSECNKQLKENLETNSDLKDKFTTEQLEQIENGDTPDGYTWHHNEKSGKLQLVDSDIHGKTGHTGGKSIWGGGSENR